MSFPTDQEHYDAVKAALDAAEARPFGYGDEVTEDNYTLLTVSPRAGGQLRGGGTNGVRGVRITLLFVGTDIDNVNEMRRRGNEALGDGQQLTVAGQITSPVQFETGDPAGPDGDLDAAGSWFSAGSTFTYWV